MPNIHGLGMRLEPGLELCAIVSLQNEDMEWQSFPNLVEEADCCALIAGVVDLLICMLD